MSDFSTSKIKMPICGFLSSLQVQNSQAKATTVNREVVPNSRTLHILDVSEHNKRQLQLSIQHLLLIAFFLATIAKSSIGKEIESTSTEHILIEKMELRTAINTDSILIEQRTLHDFSQVGKKDEFYICIRGKSIAEGQVIFTIVSHDKIPILKEEFPSYLLMNDGFEGDLESVKGREKYMTNRIREFFNEKSFYSPAIKQNEVFVEDYSIKKIWSDIQSDRTAIGFSYLIGEEDGRKIAFSKRTKKVVMYFNCC